jgi:6-pyruvoyltetrahydropterin/6-carboxytetrahydropterin synthase
MTMSIFKEFHFEAAHYLPHVPPQHQCARVHGHSFVVQLWMRGAVNPEMGWVRDFADLTDAFEPLRAQLDHRLLNDVEGLDNPTSENLAVWIWERVKGAVPELSRVVVKETAKEGAVLDRLEEPAAELQRELFSEAEGGA